MADPVVIIQQEIVSVIQPDIIHVDVGLPGPPGQRGDPADFFQTSLRLSELDTDEKRSAARTNLGLATIDGGEFFTATP